MPIYEYECKDCGKVFEYFQSPTESPLEECPQCQGKVYKLISNCSFQLKGTGWYLTDYARKSEATSEKKDKKEPGVKADSGKKDSGNGKEKPA